MKTNIDKPPPIAMQVPHISPDSGPGQKNFHQNRIIGLEMRPMIGFDWRAHHERADQSPCSSMHPRRKHSAPHMPRPGKEW
jgi:hypothetical protein